MVTHNRGCLPESEGGTRRAVTPGGGHGILEIPAASTGRLDEVGIPGISFLCFSAVSFLFMDTESGYNLRMDCGRVVETK